jgi:hypothetical protein
MDVAYPDQLRKHLDEERKAEPVLTLRRPEAPFGLNGRRAGRV